MKAPQGIDPIFWVRLTNNSPINRVPIPIREKQKGVFATVGVKLKPKKKASISHPKIELKYLGVIVLALTCYSHAQLISLQNTLHHAHHLEGGEVSRHFLMRETQNGYSCCAH